MADYDARFEPPQTLQDALDRLVVALDQIERCYIDGSGPAGRELCMWVASSRAVVHQLPTLL